MKHIRQRPSVSATYVPGEEKSVTVHGRASILEMKSEENSGLRKTILDIYTPKYGAEWEKFFDSNVYVRIDPLRMFVLQP